MAVDPRELEKIYETGKSDAKDKLYAAQDKLKGVILPVEDEEAEHDNEAEEVASQQVNTEEVSDSTSTSDDSSSDDQGEKASTPPTVEERIEALSKLLEAERLERERMQLEADKWRFVASREAGKRGYEQNKQKTEERIPSDLASIAEQVSQHDDGVSVSDEWKRDVSRELANRVVYDELGTFAEQFKDSEELAPIMQPILQAKRADYAEALESGNPATVRKATKMLLKESYLEAKSQQLRNLEKQANDKRTSHTEAVNKKKLAAEIPGGGKSSNQASVKKSIKDLSNEELLALYEKRRNAGLE